MIPERRPRKIAKLPPVIKEGQLQEVMTFMQKDNPEYFRLIDFVTKIGRPLGECASIERKDVVWSGRRPVEIIIRSSRAKLMKDIHLKIPYYLTSCVQDAYRRSVRNNSKYLFFDGNSLMRFKNLFLMYFRTATRRVLGFSLAFFRFYYKHRYWLFVSKQAAACNGQNVNSNVTVCRHCQGKMRKGAKRIIVYKDDRFEISVHSGKCFREYDQEWISGEEAIKRGVILGICVDCLRPVRAKERFRISRCGTPEDFEKWKSTFADPKTLVFRHYKCGQSRACF